MHDTSRYYCQVDATRLTFIDDVIGLTSRINTGIFWHSSLNMSHFMMEVVSEKRIQYQFRVRCTHNYRKLCPMFAIVTCTVGFRRSRPLSCYCSFTYLLTHKLVNECFNADMICFLYCCCQNDETQLIC